MKILHVFDHSLPVQDGYSYRSLAILRQQRALGWQTVQLTGIKQACPALHEDAAGLRFHRTQPDGDWTCRLPVVGGHLEVVRTLRRRIGELVDAERPDILHAHSPSLNGLAALAVARERRLPLVYEVRAFWEDAAVDQGTARQGDLRYRATRMSETYVLRRASAVTTICEGLRTAMIQRGISAGKISVIPNGVQADAFQFGLPRDDALAATLGLRGAFVLGFIGSFYAYEGLDLLIEAFPRIAQALPRARLLLVGGGIEDDRLRAQAKAGGFADRIVFTGRVPHDLVERYYSLLDLAMFPRHSLRLTETVTPLKPLESMAMGRVCIASDVGGHRELIEHGRTGFLFPAGHAEALAEAVTTHAADPQALERVRQEGRAYAERERSWAASVAGYARIYPKLTAVS